MISSDTTSPTAPDRKKRFWTRGRVAITVIAAIVGAPSLMSCNSSEVTNNNTAANSPVNTQPNTTTNVAPPPAFVALPAGVRDTKLQTLDGQSFKLSDYKDKVLIVNMWATWCGPCRLEMPELVKMSNEYKARGLVVLGLATTYNEQNDPQRVKDYVKTQNVPYKIIWDDGTLAGPLVQAVQGKSVIPQSFIISRDGRIMKHFTGYDAMRTPQLMRLAIEEALEDKTKA